MIQTLSETTTHTNGFSRGRSAVLAEDWRHSALDAMQQSASEDGTPIHLLLEAARQYAPERAIHTFFADRNATLRSLHGIGAQVKPVYANAAFLDDDEPSESPLHYGWWHVSLPNAQNDTAFELILVPPTNQFAVIADDMTKATAIVNQLMAEVNRFRHRCRRFAGTWTDAPELSAEADKVSWDDIVLAPDLLQDIRRTIDQFFTSREAFRTIGFPWRRGVLLVGPPGTGKTMVCKAAAAAHPEVPFLYVGDVRHNGNLHQIFQHARDSAPCILAFEDLDGLIDRSNRTFFLNELDGFRNNDGILIIASSNHPERIDEALLKRPSRFDRVYHIGLPGRPERAEYARRFLQRLPNLASDFDIESLAQSVASATEGFTPAFLKEAFLSGLLQLAHEGVTTLDSRYHNAVTEQVEMLRKYLRKAKNPESMADMMASADGNDSIGFRGRSGFRQSDPDGDFDD